MEWYRETIAAGSKDAVALEDSIFIKGYGAEYGSRMLAGFRATFDAAVVERLSTAGIPVVGKAATAEFGLPAIAGEGGGLSGAARSVLEGGCAACLCNDLFGLYRREAARNGLCYIHPTYGTVSRYGLIPLAQSMDGIGVLCRDMARGFELLSLIAGKDGRDGAMLPQASYRYGCEGKPVIRAAKGLVNLPGIEETEVAHLDVCAQVMYILAAAEISNNLTRYDGVKFGYRAPDAADLESLYVRSRTEGLGIEAKLATVMGAFVLSDGQYAARYEKAMKVRRLIRQSLSFDGYDVLALPASLGDDDYDNLALCALPALAGLPSVTFALNGKGIQLIAAAGNEGALYAAWEDMKA